MNEITKIEEDYTKISMVTGRLLKTRARVPKETILKALESYYGVMEHVELAQLAGVHPRTLYNHVKKWKASERYDDWLDREWHKYHNSSEVPAIYKYQALTKLKIQRMADSSIMLATDEGNRKDNATKINEALLAIREEIEIKA